MKTGEIIEIEEVALGKTSSRLSSFIFFLLCFIPIFGTILFGAVDNTTWILVLICTALVVLAWLGESWNAGGIVLNTSPLQLPLIGLILIGGIHLLPLGFQSLDPYATRFFVINLIVFLVYFAACLTFINTERRMSKIVWGIVIFGSLMAFFGILQRLSNPDGIYGMRETPWSISFGPFVNQHHFASFMQMTGGLALGLLLSADMTREKKVLVATAVGIMSVAVISTGSRGGLLAFVSVVAIVFLLNFLSGRWSAKSEEALSEGKRRLAGAVIAGVAIGFMTLALVFFIGSDESLMRGIGAVNENADISSGRLHFWPIALQIFLDNPILGVGFDAFAVAYTKYDDLSGVLRVDHSHNEYLQFLADAGIAGFACLAAFIFLLFKLGLRKIAATDGMTRAATIGALGGCFGIIVHSFFDFPLRTSSNAFFFLLLATIATVSVESAAKTTSRRRRHRSTAPGH